MSSCTQCLQRICRKHPLQDHGEREQKLQDKVAEMNSKVLEKAYKELEAFNKSKQLERDLSLEADNYKTAMEFERMKATLQKPKKRSFEEAKLSQNSSLNPSVIATMLHDSDSSANATTSSSSEDSDDGKRKRKYSKSLHKERRRDKVRGKDKDRRDRSRSRDRKRDRDRDRNRHRSSHKRSHKDGKKYRKHRDRDRDRSSERRQASDDTGGNTQSTGNNKRDKCSDDYKDRKRDRYHS